MEVWVDAVSESMFGLRDNLLRGLPPSGQIAFPQIILAQARDEHGLALDRFAFDLSYICPVVGCLDLRSEALLVPILLRTCRTGYNRGW